VFFGLWIKSVHRLTSENDKVFFGLWIKTVHRLTNANDKVFFGLWIKTVHRLTNENDKVFFGLWIKTVHRLTNEIDKVFFGLWIKSVHRLTNEHNKVFFGLWIKSVHRLVSGNDNGFFRQLIETNPSKKHAIMCNCIRSNPCIHTDMRLMHILLLCLSCIIGILCVLSMHWLGVTWLEGSDIRQFTNVYTLRLWSLGQACSITAFMISLYCYTFSSRVYNDIMVVLPCLLVTLALLETLVLLQEKAFLVIFMVIHCTLVAWMIIAFIMHFPAMWPVRILHVIWGIHTVIMQCFNYWYTFLYSPYQPVYYPDMFDTSLCEQSNTDDINDSKPNFYIDTSDEMELNSPSVRLDVINLDGP
jgi:type IV secretory pathway VirB3-like protein